MNDLIIPGYDAFCKLSETLIVVANNSLNINWKKCKFLQRQVEFHIIEDACVKPSPDKVHAVQNFLQSRSLKQLQSVLGLTSYFRKFVKNARIAPAVRGKRRTAFSLWIGTTSRIQ